VPFPELSVELPLLPTYQVFMRPHFDLIGWQVFQGQGLLRGLIQRCLGDAVASVLKLVRDDRDVTILAWRDARLVLLNV